MNRKKLLIVAGIIAVIGIMTANLQYTYSDYGIKTNSLHSEVLAQYPSCYLEQQNFDRAQSDFNSARCYGFTIGNAPPCSPYTGHCKDLCERRESARAALNKCKGYSNPGGGNPGGSSSGTGTGTGTGNTWDYWTEVSEVCKKSETIYNNGNHTIITGRKVSCLRGGSQTSCTDTFGECK